MLHSVHYKNSVIVYLESPRKWIASHNSRIKIFSKVQLEGLTIIPLEVYIENGLCKIKIGLCKGKKVFDKRNDIKEKNVKRDLEKNYKVRY